MIPPSVSLRLTDGSERFVPLGSTSPAPIGSGDYAYVDDGNEILCRLEHKQVEKTKVTEGTPFRSHLEGLVLRTAQLMRVSIADVSAEIELRNEYVGAGYAVIGDLEREAINLLAQTKGILVDPVYTGLALGGLIDMIRSGTFKPNDCVLFWHTGGTPALFSYAEQLL